ncbi:hypothetical protein F5Y06DRAFT_22824 [Hypoxylon sp. FL0890]|nr:hypothetical protein F5Y06DRAFT_22824 [Hypoxylon sp. FL0890]
MAARFSFHSSGSRVALAWSKYPCIASRLSAPYYRIYKHTSNGAGCRWTSTVHHNKDESEPTNYFTLSDTQTSPSLKFDLHAFEVRASKDGGRHALDILESLDHEPRCDDSLEFYKGIICLKAYRGLFAPLSVEKAKEIISIDNAGIRVMSWALKPNIRELIEGNHEENGVLLRVISDIVVGAGHADVLKEWIHDQPEFLCGKTRKEMYDLMDWKGRLLSKLLEALIWWQPDGRADPAYDLFSEMSKEHFKYRKFKLCSPYDHVPFAPSRTLLSRLMTMEFPSSPESFDRCKQWIAAHSHTIACELFQGAVYSLHHPTHPTADPLLLFLHVADNTSPSSASAIFLSLRYRLSSPTAMNWASFIRHIGARGAELLRQADRNTDAEWLVKILEKTWGEKSDVCRKHEQLLKLVREGQDLPPLESSHWQAKA